MFQLSDEQVARITELVESGEFADCAAALSWLETLVDWVIETRALPPIEHSPEFLASLDEAGASARRGESASFASAKEAQAALWPTAANSGQ